MHTVGGANDKRDPSSLRSLGMTTKDKGAIEVKKKDQHLKVKGSGIRKGMAAKNKSTSRVKRKTHP
jgi:hypothetical protein